MYTKKKNNILKQYIHNTLTHINKIFTDIIYRYKSEPQLKNVH